MTDLRLEDFLCTGDISIVVAMQRISNNRHGILFITDSELHLLGSLTDGDIRRVLMQLINGEYAPDDPERFRTLYNSLLNTISTSKADTYFILKDFRSYADAQKRVEEAYKDEAGWAKKAILNTAHCGKFTSDRTIKEYVDDIWHLDKVTIRRK